MKCIKTFTIIFLAWGFLIGFATTTTAAESDPVRGKETLLAPLETKFLTGRALAASNGAGVKTSSANLVTRVAPGELLPVSVKLVNFGGGRRVDVTIDYYILNEKGDVVLTEKETVAVETTASFIKILQIPRDIQPGQYTAESSITYQGQKVPATANYQFTVERKIAGMFVSQFLIYGVITLIVGIIFAIIGRIVKKNFARAALHHMNILK